MSELLKKYGFIYAGNCHCDGYLTEKYHYKSYQCKIRIKKNTFKIKENGHSITQWVPIHKLEETLKHITADVAVQA